MFLHAARTTNARHNSTVRLTTAAAKTQKPSPCVHKIIDHVLRETFELLIDYVESTQEEITLVGNLGHTCDSSTAL